MNVWAVPLLFFAPLAPPKPGQETALGELRFGAFDSRREGGDVIYVVSDLRFRRGDYRLTGDYAVLWLDADKYESYFQKREGDKLHNPDLPPPSRGRLPGVALEDLLDPKTADPKKQKKAEEFQLPPELLREAYVEGSVYFAQRDEQVIQGSRIYLDLVSGRALIAEGTLRMRSEFHGAATPVSVKAKWFRREASGRFVGDDADYTTCTYGRPHFHIHSEQLWIEPGPEGNTIDAYRSTLTYGDTGVLYIPRLEIDPDESDAILFKGARLGTSSVYGFFAYTRWGHGFRTLGEDFNEWLLGKRLPFKGSWELRIDQRRKRGQGFGPEISWRTPHVYEGSLTTYFTHDITQDGDQLWYRNKLVRANEDRGRARLQNRIFLDEDLTFDTELNYQSDPGFMPEFFRKEFFVDKEPENALYLRFARENQAFTATASFALNSFDPTPTSGYGLPNATPHVAPALKESLPEFQHFLFNQPVFSLSLPGGTGEYADRELPVYYTEKSSLGYVRRHPPKGLEFVPGSVSLLPSVTQAAERFDTEHELRAPFQADPFVIAPFLTERFTYYSRAATGDQTERVASEAGVRFATHFEGSLTENFAHRIDPSITYDNTFLVTRDPSELLQFDDSDAVAKNDRILFQVRNVVLEKGALERKKGDHFWEPPADLNLRLPMFLNPDRDNGGRRFADLEENLVFYTSIASGPFRGLQGRVESKTDIDRNHRLDFLSGGVGSSPFDGVSVAANFLYLRDLTTGALTNSIFTGSVFYSYGEKWQVGLSSSYDLHTKQALGHNVVFRRLGHEWVLEASVARNALTGESIVAFNVQPLFLFQRGRQISAVTGFLNASATGLPYYTSGGY